MDDRASVFNVVPSLAVIKGRPVFVEQGRYSQLRLQGKVPKVDEVARALFDRFKTLHYLDILSFRTGEPEIATIKELCESDGELWTDVGARTSDPLIDAIMAGATTCIVSTKMMANLSEFASAFELTDDLIVQVDLDEGIISPDPDIRAMSPLSFCREMRELGIGTLVLDIDAPTGTRASTVKGIVEGLDGRAKVYVGMEELEETDSLRAAGASGGLISCSKVLEEA